MLSAHKALYWVDQNALLVSDIHFGKAAHFRKAGIAIPAQLHLEELALLNELISHFRPTKLWILGDLFHSNWNNEWQIFSHWVKFHSSLEVQLIKGNHDILAMANYADAGIKVVDELTVGPFSLSHEPSHKANDLYTISGHIHPSVRLRGAARQGIRLPCFYFGKSYALLPAFGRFTGMANVKVFKDDQVFAIANDEVIPIK